MYLFSCITLYNGSILKIEESLTPAFPLSNGGHVKYLITDFGTSSKWNQTLLVHSEVQHKRNSNRIISKKMVILNQPPFQAASAAFHLTQLKYQQALLVANPG